ncbi:hypothetical protein CM15mP43_10430 [bacterium]|nr:MAG: hypothetical protein CM15mP43_10430 [bacterium]
MKRPIKSSFCIAFNLSKCLFVLFHFLIESFLALFLFYPLQKHMFSSTKTNSLCTKFNSCSCITWTSALVLISSVLNESAHFKIVEKYYIFQKQFLHISLHNWITSEATTGISPEKLFLQSHL